MRRTRRSIGRLSALVLVVSLGIAPRAEGPKGDGEWTVLIGEGTLDAFKGTATNWEKVGAVAVDPKNVKKLVATPGEGVAFNGPGGRGANLITKEAFGDVEVHVEFLIPKGSNAGVKLEGVYEIQIFDSFGKKTKLDGGDNGGVYPRAELLPKYHHIDDGYAPRTNASKPPGEWQTLDIAFRAPRVDADGKKTADARFVRVVLNGQVVHEDLAVPCPTGNVWRAKEKPTGPIMLQGDHGAVAFRNVKVRPLASSAAR